MKALGMIEVYSFTTAVCVGDVAAKAADVKVIAFDRNRPIREDVPAPLVMIVKVEGSVSAVKSAVEAGEAYARAEGKFIVSHIIANPDNGTEKMAYLLDVNRDKYNKSLPKTMKDYPEEKIKDVDGAFGLLEISGCVASVEALDSMTKAADVRIIHTEKRLGGRLVTLVVMGQVSAVKAAVEAGAKNAAHLGKIYGTAVIPRPHREVGKYFEF